MLSFIVLLMTPFFSAADRRRVPVCQPLPDDTTKQPISASLIANLGNTGRLALAEIEPFVRLVPIDANGFRRSKMMPVLEMIRDDRPSKDPLQVIRQTGEWPYRLHDGVHRFYASRTLGFTHVPAEVIDPTC